MKGYTKLKDETSTHDGPSRLANRSDHVFRLSQLAIVATVASLAALQLWSWPPKIMHHQQEAYSRIVVGERTLQRASNGNLCSTSAFLRAVSEIKVDPLGTSARNNSLTSFEPSDFAFSFDFPAPCPAPRVFTSAEACDLLGAFGGLFLRGDSFVRHVMNALQIILSGAADGAVFANKEFCTGDQLFDDGKQCRFSVVNNTQNGDSVCSGSAWVYNIDSENCEIESDSHLADFHAWRHQQPSRKAALSPIYIASHGIHCNFDVEFPIFGVFKPFLTWAANAYPQPLLLWLGIHAPAINKPERFRTTQFPPQVRNYNSRIRKALSDLQPANPPPAAGAFSIMEFYGMTDGAASFDGSHFMWQINIEKAQLLLNYLDILWWEAEALGSVWHPQTERV